MTALLAVIASGGMARADTGEKPRIDIYGFVQADFIYDFNRVDPTYNAGLRPSTIPVGDANLVGMDGETIFSVRQTRFGVNGFIPTDMGEAKTKFEFDLFGIGADAGQTTIKLRHAYGEIGQFLAGQTYSLFMDADITPNTLDFWGPSGEISFRTIQVRWTFLNAKGSKVAVSLEAPGASIDAGNTNVIDPNLNVTSWNKYPDLIGKYRMDGDWGHFQAAGILRWLGYNSTDGSVSGHQTG
jgi:DcaP outer membrane protein